MSQKIKHRISGDFNVSHNTSQYKFVGADGYSHNNDFVMSDQLIDWQVGKQRRTKKQAPALF